jgi:hypothetical protein
LFSEVFEGKTSITIEEDWDVPASFLEAMKYVGSFIVKAGTYQIQSSKDEVVITLTQK